MENQASQRDQDQKSHARTVRRILHFQPSPKGVVIRIWKKRGGRKKRKKRKERNNNNNNDNKKILQLMDDVISNCSRETNEVRPEEEKSSALDKFRSVFFTRLIACRVIGC